MLLCKTTPKIIKKDTTLLIPVEEMCFSKNRNIEFFKSKFNIVKTEFRI
jgi:hypothetical protein